MSRIKYRPSIDGMRSIAVISVLLFHLDKSILPGGFVGVDIFFVISGYLITSIIYSNCENNQFSLLRFYQRRISRIFPVSFTVSLIILITSYFLYTPQDFASAGALATASSLSVANIKLMLQGNYFEVSPDAQPFLHFWSLSLEEQFYLFLPIMLVIAYRLRISQKWLLILSGLSILASFILCVYMTSFNPTWAFYLLPTRAWELLAGTALAFEAIRKRNDKATKIDSWISILGLALIVFSLITLNEQSNFPGYIAALPVIGSVMLIGRSYNPQQITERFLSQPTFILIGKLSYSLYLWHWPIYCFTDYTFYSQSFAIRTALKIGMTIIIAIASFYFLENPTRLFLNQSNKRQLTFIGCTAGILIFSIIGIQIRSSNYLNASFSSVSSGGITLNKKVSEPAIALMGDSNGSMYGLTMKNMANELNTRVQVMSVAAGNPFPPSQLYNDSIQFVSKEKPFITILVAEWAGKIADKPKELKKVLSDILLHSQHVILITQPPTLPEHATREKIRQHGLQSIYENSYLSDVRKKMNKFLLSLQSDRIHVVDVDPIFVTRNGQIKFADNFGRQIYHDRTHLSGFGADLVGKKISQQISTLLNSDAQAKTNGIK